MAEITLPRLVTPVAGLLSGSTEGLARALEVLCEELGPPVRLSSYWPFPRPEYYAATMGPGLLRQYVSFSTPQDPGWLGPFKCRTYELEALLAQDAEVERPANIDPGYVGAGKLVLATAKDRAHRIYLARGIYAEVTLIVEQGRFKPLRWTYEDYRSELALAFFDQVREDFLAR